MIKRAIRMGVFVLLFPVLLLAQEAVDLQVINQIKQEEYQHSQVMETLFYLTDVYGPRLMNSPNYRRAAEWCRNKLSEWGLANAHLESWGAFGRGWQLKKFSLEMLEPVYRPLIAFPKAWTPGTSGVITGSPVLVVIKSDADFEKYRGKLNGAIVLTQQEQKIKPEFTPDARRNDEKSLQELAQAPEPGAQPSWRARREEYRKRMALRRKMRKFFAEEGAALLLQPSRGQDGTVFVTGGGSYRTNAAPALPSVVVATEYYNRLVRLLRHNIPVTLRAEIQTAYTARDTLGYNVIAEIPGSDRKLKRELVMLGGHLDSWHAGTGATDNAAGVAVCMEAVRILTALNLKPRRTVRIALWGAEELGLLGSRGYVKQHFADPKTMELKPEHAKLSAYFNLDNGSGKIRGIYLQGNDAVRPIFEAYLKPFHDMGATTVTIRNTGGTDHLSFDAVGLPGFQFIQDPLEYFTRTHHSNMDVYDHCSKSDLMQASIILASFVYHTAMRDQKLPRKPLPEPRQTAGSR